MRSLVRISSGIDAVFASQITLLRDLKDQILDPVLQVIFKIRNLGMFDLRDAVFLKISHLLILLQYFCNPRVFQRCILMRTQLPKKLIFFRILQRDHSTCASVIQIKPVIGVKQSEYVLFDWESPPGIFRKRLRKEHDKRND